MKTKVYSKQGKVTKEITLNDEVFDSKVRQGTIYEAIKNELANSRVGTACSKGRGEITASTQKPWRQKGTGRARSGDRKSPLWVGGGVAFGPKPRDFSYRIPKKMKRLAFKSILSLKTKEERLKVVEDFSVDSGKTKDLLKILKNLIPSERAVIILSDDDRMIKRAGANIPWLKLLAYNRLRAHDLFYSKTILVLEKAAVGLNDFYGEKKNG
ncbi:MAG: 50S ribosomal protein L4 [Spirochaetales bacterium]|nr:50S ribosomal protein L4 [Spirochaetales bacterium]